MYLNKNLLWSLNAMNMMVTERDVYIFTAFPIECFRYHSA